MSGNVEGQGSSSTAVPEVDGAQASNAPEPQPLLHPELAGVHLGLAEEDVERNEGINPGVYGESPQPYDEVKNLLWIKRNTVYSTALEEWDRKAKLLSARVDKKEKRSGDLKNEVYQLVGFFSVFQGVVLTAVTQLTQSGDEHHNCKRVWCPVLLTTLAWGVAIVGVWQKLSRIQLIDDERSEEDKSRREAIQRASFLRNYGKKFTFKKLKESTKRKQPRTFFGFNRHFWINRFGVLAFILSVFSGIFVASYFLILCNRGMAPINVWDPTPPAP